MQTKFLLALLSVLVLLTGCKNAVEDDPMSPFGEPSADHLEGKVGAEEWFFGAGRAKPVDGRPNFLSIDLYGSIPDGDICNYTPATDQDRIQFTIEKSTGTFQLDSTKDQTVNFHVKQNEKVLAATQGSIWITNINARTIKGKLKAVYSEDNAVNGQFLVINCSN